MTSARIRGASVACTLLVFASGFVNIEDSAADDVSDLVRALKDPTRRGAHAGTALALGALSQPGSDAEAALIDVLAGDDPVIAACAAHALGRVGRPSAGLFAALIQATEFSVTLRAPEEGATGWNRVKDRAFTEALLFRSGEGWTDWIVFRTWAAERVAQFLHVPIRTTRPPEAAPRPSRGGPWRTETMRAAVADAAPVVLEIVGAEPAAASRWRLDPGGEKLTPEPAARPRRPYSGAQPGALRDLVARTARSALHAILTRADEAWVRRALTHTHAIVREAALRVLARGRDPAPFAGEVFDILVSEPRDRRAARVFEKVGPSAGPVLAAAIESGDATRRDPALDWVSSMGADAKAAIPAVARLLEQGDVVPESTLFRAISAVGRDAAAATEALRIFVRARRQHYEVALDTLADIGPPAKAAVPELVELARTRPAFGHGRLRATLALAAIDPGHRELTGFVVACLSDPNDNVIELACLHVGGWSKAPSEVRRALRKATHHENRRVRAAAQEALLRLSSPTK